MHRPGLAVIGCGFVGRGAHVPACAALEGGRLVGVADPDETRREKARQKYQVPLACDHYQPLIDHPDVEAVIVATPTTLHTEVALAAIAAGKHVLCEMPLAANLEDADRMIAAADRQGVILMPGLTFRFTPNFVRVRQKLQSGQIGSPVSFSYRELIPALDLSRQWPADCWMWQVEQSGGPLFTLAVWSLDLICWLFDARIQRVDSAVRYSSLTGSSGTRGYDCHAVIELTSGLAGSLHYSGSVTKSAAACQLEIVGDTTNVIRTCDNDSVVLLRDEPSATHWHLSEPGPAMWGHLQQDQYFVDCLRRQQAPDITADAGRHAMEIAWRLAQI